MEENDMGSWITLSREWAMYHFPAGDSVTAFKNGIPHARIHLKGIELQLHLVPAFVAEALRRKWCELRGWEVIRDDRLHGISVRVKRPDGQHFVIACRADDLDDSYPYPLRMLIKTIQEGSAYPSVMEDFLDTFRPQGKWKTSGCHMMRQVKKWAKFQSESLVRLNSCDDGCASDSLLVTIFDRTPVDGSFASVFFIAQNANAPVEMHFSRPEWEAFNWDSFNAARAC